MKKFIGLFTKGKPTIYECEVSVVLLRPCGLKDGEDLYKVESPASIKNELWYSFFFSDSKEEAIERVSKLIKEGLERDQIKMNIPFSEEEYLKLISEINIGAL